MSDQVSLQAEMQALMDKYGREACRNALDESPSSSDDSKEETARPTIRKEGQRSYTDKEKASAKTSWNLARRAVVDNLHISKQAAQLQSHQNLQLAMLNASFDSMLAIDPMGIIVTVNRACLETFQYPNEQDLIGQNISIIVGGLHAAHHDAYLHAYRTTGRTKLMGTRRELTARRKDGTEFPVIVGLQQVENGLVVGYVRDISDEHARRKLMEESLAEATLKAAVLDAAFDSMFTISSLGTILTVNRAAVQTFGYDSVDDMVGQNINICVGAAHAAHHDGYLRRYKETGETRLIGTMRELTARRKDGSEFPVKLGIERVSRHKKAKTGNDTADEEDDYVLVGFVRDITEEVERRKLAVIQESQRKLKVAMLDASFDSMFAIDSVGKILTVNRAAVQTFGYSSDAELLGQNISVIVGGMHAANHDAYMKRYMTTGETRLIGTRRELTARRKDGTEFPVMVGIEVIEPGDATGEKLLVGYVRDITEEVERRKLARQQEAQRKMKAAILDASFDSMFAIDSVGTILTVNRAAITTFGYDDENELLGQNISKIVGGVHAAKHDSYMKRYMDTGETRLIGTKRELTARRKDNSEFPVLVGIEVIHPEGDDSEKLLVGYVRDISEEVERRKLAAQQEAQRKMKAAILDASFDSMFAIDSVGKILTVNRAAIKTFGYENEAELLGQNISIIVGGLHAAKHDSYMKRYMDTGETRLIGTKRELTARRKDNTEFPVLVGIEVIEQGDTKLLVGYVRDISEEVERRKLAAEQEAQRKMKAAILDASFDSMFAIDSVGKILTVNRAAIETFGYKSQDELLGKNINIVVGGIHAAKHDSYMKRYMDTGETRLIGTRRELTARRKNGTEFPVVVGISVVKNEGLPPLLVGYIRDITEEKRSLQLAVEKRAAEELLLNMLPREIALRLMENPNHLADHHTDATILFADIVGFTKLSSRLDPIQVVEVLNDLFTRFDKLVELYNLNKVKTIGDCFMVTSVPSDSDGRQGCLTVCHFAFDMVQALLGYNEEHSDEPLNLRVGINTGPVVAGVVGQKRFLYDLWGDAVNVASRMESTGIPGEIQVTKAVVDTVGAGSFTFQSRGSITVKGKGEMQTYFLKTRKARPGTGLHHYESNRTLESSSNTMDDFSN